MTFFVFLCVFLISCGSVLIMLLGMVEIFIQLFTVPQQKGIIFFKDPLAERMEKALKFKRGNSKAPTS